MYRAKPLQITPRHALTFLDPFTMDNIKQFVNVERIQNGVELRLQDKNAAVPVNAVVTVNDKSAIATVPTTQKPAIAATAQQCLG
jgi:hypothetical protein